jgi:putative endonuclease
MHGHLETFGQVGPIQSWLARRSRTSLGRWGEWVALKWLLYQGWDVVARNWNSRRGELDLIAWDQEQLVFVEVKTRLAGGLSRPENAVDDEKRDQLEALAISFLSRFEAGEVPIRFDLIAIETVDRRRFKLRHYLGFM